MYIFILNIGLCLLYLVLFYFLPFFFGQKIEKINRKSFFSLFLIILFTFLNYLLISNISNQEICNRILHGLGGGFIAFLAYFLATKDNRVSLNKFQFFVLGTLLVTALGVLNEIVEFFMQNYMNLIMAFSVNDTWLDLISNSVGILIASIIFVPFINNKKNLEQII